MIKAVIFDLGGVLIDKPDAWNTYCAKTLNVSVDAFVAARKLFETERQKGKLPEDIYWQKMKEQLHTNVPIDQDLWVKSFQYVYRKKEDVFAVVDTLRKKGIKTALLSNTEIPVMNFIKKQHLTDFDAFIFSCETGLLKPEKEIYEYALQKLHVLPDEAVMIDDAQENIDGAKAVGIHGILFTDLPLLIHDMEQLGITL